MKTFGTSVFTLNFDSSPHRTKQAMENLIEIKKMNFFFMSIPC